MKKMINCCVLIFVSALFCNAIAGQINEVVLIDGGTILGEIVSHHDGEYIIKSPTLGTLKIDESKIRVIRIQHGPSVEKNPPDAPKQYSNQDIQSIQKSIMNNDKIMQKVLSLQTNPQMKEILNDPDILEALNSGNFSALLSNPKLLEMLNNPEIKEIQKEIFTPEAGNK
jgi:hypothetical protein